LDTDVAGMAGFGLDRYGRFVDPLRGLAGGLAGLAFAPASVTVRDIE
jgi:hypothetical protein